MRPRSAEAGSGVNECNRDLSPFETLAYRSGGSDNVLFADQPSRIAVYAQNSSRAWNAIMRGLLSPPSPTPSKPVGGEVVYVSAPNPLCVEGFPGMPA